MQPIFTARRDVKIRILVKSEEFTAALNIFKHLGDALLTMIDVHLYPKLAVNMLGQMLSGIDAPVLTARTAEGEHQRSETALNVATHMGIGQPIDTFQEGEYLAIIFKESDHRLIETCQFFVRLIASGIVRATAVEHISSAIARLILRNAFAIGEAEDAHHKRSLAVVFGIGGWTVLGMSLIGILVGCLITIGTI